MVTVAVLLLPGMGLLLFTMTYLEDRLFHDPPEAPARRHARRRHLRLIPGDRGRHSPAAPGPEPAALPAALPAADRDAA